MAAGLCSALEDADRTGAGPMIVQFRAEGGALIASAWLLEEF